MQKKRHSLNWYFILFLIIILTVFFALSLIWWNILSEKVKNHVLDSYSQNLRFYEAQLTQQMEQTEKYIYTLFQNPLYRNLEQKKGSGKYEYAKTNLASSLCESDVLNSGITDALNIYIMGSEDVIGYRDNSRISFLENRSLLENAKECENQGWHRQLIGDEVYLLRTVSYRNTLVSAYIKERKITEEWKLSFDEEIELLISEPGGSFEEKGYFTLIRDFGGQDLKLRIRIPESKVSVALYTDGRLYILVLLACILLLSGSMVFFHRMLLKPVLEMEQTIQQIGNSETEQRMPENQSGLELYSLALNFNQMMDRIKKLKIQTYELKLAGEKSKLLNLQLQINPHLLLNSLNTIYGLAELHDFPAIQQFSMNLVKYFRYSLRDINRLVTLKEEVEFTQSYVKVQQVRYPNRFYVLYDVDEKLFPLQIPPLLIQNFVENSTKYALCDHEVEVVVTARLSENCLRLSIRDDGRGIDPEILARIRENQPLKMNGVSHLGIWNCRNRMRLYYGEKAKFSIISEPGEGTIVWMEIPVSEEE